MTDAFFEQGECFKCKAAAHKRCENCHRFFCEDHITKIDVTPDKKIDVCFSCLNNAKPGDKLAGVMMTEKMLRS